MVFLSNANTMVLNWRKKMLGWRKGERKRKAGCLLLTGLHIFLLRVDGWKENVHFPSKKSKKKSCHHA